MAKNYVSISLLMVLASTWGMLVTSQQQPLVPMMKNRQSRHIFLFPQVTPAENDLPSFDFDYSPYNHPAMNIPAEEGSFTNERSEPRIPGRFNRPSITSPSLYSAGDSGTSGGRTFAGFASFFGSRNVPLCPQCPQCPAFPVIPPCPAPSAPASCPPLPSQQGETTISLTPESMECGMAALLMTDSLSPCVKVSAAPKGEIDVEFSIPATPATDPQVVSIGIVAVQPNTQVKLKCTAIPTGSPGSLAKTQNGKIVLGSTVTTTGFVQIIAAVTGDSTGKTLKCSWTSIP